jgi:hypothetical protein
MARPSTLENNIDLAQQYVDGDYVAAGDLIPSVAGLAVYLGKTRETMYAWGRDNKQFSDILAKLLTVQEKTLLAGGLGGTMNSTISKLVLSKHGYSDKAEVEQKITATPAIEIVWKSPTT